MSNSFQYNLFGSSIPKVRRIERISNISENQSQPQPQYRDSYQTNDYIISPNPFSNTGEAKLKENKDKEKIKQLTYEDLQKLNSQGKAIKFTNPARFKADKEEVLQENQKLKKVNNNKDSKLKSNMKKVTKIERIVPKSANNNDRNTEEKRQPRDSIKVQEEIERDNQINNPFKSGEKRQPRDSIRNSDNLEGNENLVNNNKEEFFSNNQNINQNYYPEDEEVHDEYKNPELLQDNQNFENTDKNFENENKISDGFPDTNEQILEQENVEEQNKDENKDFDETKGIYNKERMPRDSLKKSTDEIIEDNNEDNVDLNENEEVEKAQDVVDQPDNNPDEVNNEEIEKEEDYNEKMNENVLEIDFSDSIVNDQSEIDMLIQKVSQIKEIKGYKLIYKATKDGDSSKDFHRLCDQAQSSVVFIKTRSGHRFGGYTSQSWEGDNISKIDNTAFIFSLDKKAIYEVIPEEEAIGCYPKFGPVFCGCQIRVYDHSLNYGGSTFKKGVNYNTNEDFELTEGEQAFGIDEIEVYEV